MAITFRAKGESPGADSDTCVITKPIGLTAGDLMIAHIAVRYNGTTVGTVSSPAGWTIIREDESVNSLLASLLWKIADSADAAASDFTFTASLTVRSNIGVISAWYEAGETLKVNASNGQSQNSATITSPSITPKANSMILMFCAIANNNTQSNYAIADDNPGSWDERYDIAKDLLSDCAIALGSALRPEASSTGNGTATSSGTGKNVGQLVAIGIKPTSRGWWSK